MKKILSSDRYHISVRREGEHVLRLLSKIKSNQYRNVVPHDVVYNTVGIDNRETDVF